MLDRDIYYILMLFDLIDGIYVLQNDMQVAINSLELRIDSVENDLALHIFDYSNPHNVNENQMSATNDLVTIFENNLA